MHNVTPLIVATLALGLAACSSAEQLPATPIVKAAEPAVTSPVKDIAATTKTATPATARPAQPSLASLLPSEHEALPHSRPASPPNSVRRDTTPIPLEDASSVEPWVPLKASSSTLDAIKEPAPVDYLPRSSLEVVTIEPAVTVPRPPSPLLSSPARPPARTELERLNPGMPRLVGPAPRAENIIARPRIKPNRNARSSGFETASTGIAIPNTPSLVGYTASLETPPSIEYEIPHIPQEEPLWCWAAAAQQAIGWVNNGRAPAQCAIVAMAHGIDVETCCNDRKGVCARTGEIPAIADLVRHYGGHAAETATVPRKPKEVYDILQTGATLLIRLRPAPHDAAVGIRHMIVVRGIEWLRLPSGRLEATLFYNDPLGSGYRAVSFDEIEGFFEQALIVRRNT